MDEELLEQEEYEVRIGAFNGPMDILVYLVQKKEVPLEQISIAEIADQFLKWVDVYSASTNMDLSKAGDFLAMASRLMALKVQELLPAEERDPEMEQEYNADREQLMKEMLEYQRFKQVASGLQEMEGENFGTYSRGRLEKTQSDDDTLADANIWQLFRAYQKSLKTKISETVHHIELDYVTIQDRQQAINNYLSVSGRALFEDLLDNDSHPIVAAVTFMAMLEMIKTDEIVFRQSELFGPIWIYRKKNNAEYADEMARETVFFSKDPDVKPGLVDAIRSQAMARSQEQTVGDLAAVMREAVQWTEKGRNVSDEDLTAMLEGKVDLSDVQSNPFAEMMKEDEAAELAEKLATGETSLQQGNLQQEESLQGTGSQNMGNNTSAEGGSTELPTEGDKEEFTPTVISANDNWTDETEKSADAATESSESVDVHGEEYTAESVENVTEISEEYSAEPAADTDAGTPSEGSDDTITAESAENPPQAEQQMSDEEFAEFMRKAQEFYSQGASDTASDSTQTDSGISSATSVTTQADSATIQNKKSDALFGAANEMTDEEYIAYLTQSAKNFGKKD